MKISEAIIINVSPTKIGGDVYTFVIQNMTDMPIENIKFDFCNILNPISFNYDDTHMPNTLIRPNIFELEYLEANCNAVVEFEKWGCMRDYSGKYELLYGGNFKAHSEYNPKSIFQDLTTSRNVRVYLNRYPQ
jgi:hypothetical protein